MTIEIDKCIIASVVLMSIFILYLAGVLTKAATIVLSCSVAISSILCFGLFAYFVYDKYFFKKEIFRKEEE